MELIRPLYLIREDDIKAWRDTNGLQFIRCACHFTDTCSVDGHGGTGSKRLEAKRLIAQLKKTTPSVEGNIFRSMENICMNAVLGYKDHEGKRHSFLDTYDMTELPEMPGAESSFHPHHQHIEYQYHLPLHVHPDSFPVSSYDIG